MNILTDKNGKRIQEHTTVKYNEGWYRVSAIFKGKKTVNLKQVFGSRILHKGVSINDIIEDEEAWHNNWTQSETYMSM
jgi:hypothetical protein